MVRRRSTPTGRRVVVVVVVLLWRVVTTLLVASIVAVGCTSNPSQSDEYLLLESQKLVVESELATVESQLEVLRAAVGDAANSPRVDSASSEAERLRDRVTELEAELAEAERFRTHFEDFAASYYPSGTPLLVVFVDDAVASDQDHLDRLEDDISRRFSVEKLSFVSKAEAYDEALILFASDDAMLSVLEENPTLLPASFRIETLTFGEGLALRSYLESLPGVTRVNLGYPGWDS